MAFLRVHTLVALLSLWPAIAQDADGYQACIQDDDSRQEQEALSALQAMARKKMSAGGLQVPVGTVSCTSAQAAGNSSEEGFYEEQLCHVLDKLNEVLAEKLPASMNVSYDLFNHNKSRCLVKGLFGGCMCTAESTARLSVDEVLGLNSFAVNEIRVGNQRAGFGQFNINGTVQLKSGSIALALEGASVFEATGCGFGMPLRGDFSASLQVEVQAAFQAVAKVGALKVCAHDIQLEVNVPSYGVQVHDLEVHLPLVPDFTIPTDMFWKALLYTKGNQLLEALSEQINTVLADETQGKQICHNYF
jgi:hypothetical protein